MWRYTASTQWHTFTNRKIIHKHTQTHGHTDTDTRSFVVFFLLLRAVLFFVFLYYFLSWNKMCFSCSLSLVSLVLFKFRLFSHWDFGFRATWIFSSSFFFLTFDLTKRTICCFSSRLFYREKLFDCAGQQFNSMCTIWCCRRQFVRFNRR